MLSNTLAAFSFIIIEKRFNCNIVTNLTFYNTISKRNDIA